MYVRAVSVGHAVPRLQFDAVVHSVFASAVNLRLGGQEPLLTLLASTEGDLPQGVRLEPSTALRFDRLQPGMSATCRHGLLRIDADVLTVDLQQAACWDSSLPHVQPRLDRAAARSSWRRAWRLLDDRQAARASELRASRLLDESAEGQPAWVAQAARVMRPLVEGTLHCDSSCVAVIHELVGLGPGLTPGGDDLLAGYLLGLHDAARGKHERLGFLAALASAVMDALPRTGDLSRTYLFHAARGEPSRALFNLAHAVCTGAGERAVAHSAEAAMSVGHTSGMDAVTGLLLGLAAWDASGLLGLNPSPPA